MARILIIDDDESFRQGCRQILEQAGYQVFESKGRRCWQRSRNY
jgi:DNA-binding NtrC family response regulator